MLKKILLLLVIGAFPVLANLHADHIDFLLNKYHKLGRFEGSVLVAEHGKIIYARGIGLADRKQGIRNETSTRFRIASMTKAFTSALILKLAEEGRLDIHASLCEYLPEFPAEKGEHITLHHLMNNTSGLQDYTNIPGFYKNRTAESYTPQQLVDLIIDLPVLAEPGKTFNYNNSNFILLGMIIEKITGKSYGQVLKEKILEPLQMSNTGYDLPGNRRPNQAIGYNRTLLGFQEADYMDLSSMYAAAGLYSTVEDLFKWDRALQTDKLLSSESRDKMFSMNNFGYGYGWSVVKAVVGAYSDTLKVITHNGGLKGFTSRIVRIPKDETVIILLRNSSGRGITEIGDKIMAILYDQPYQIPSRSAAEEVAAEMITKSTKAGLKKYEQLKVADSAEYTFAEADFNRVGYLLLNMNKFDEAIEIFKINVLAFPNSANTYDSLGEAYMVAGYSDLAIMYYNLSLQKIPNDTNLNREFKEQLKKNALAKLNRLRSN